MGFQIAIDGPAGAGKSTIARAIAAKLNFTYVDTGAMYRAMALFFLRNGIAPDDTAQIGAKCQEAEITIRHENGEQVVLLNDEPVNQFLRTEEVGNMASVSSANPQVRERLLGLQRQLAVENDVVMDGRDIGTCVLPDAQVKIFLTADSSVRAARRFKELSDKGISCDLEVIEKDIVSRDRQDSTRQFSPLRQAEDATAVDTSLLDIGQVTEAIVKIYSEKRCVFKR